MRAESHQQSEREADAAKNQLKREDHRTQFAGAIVIRLAPCNFANCGLVEAEIEERTQRGEHGIEADQAVALAAEYPKINYIEDQREDQPGGHPGKIGGDIESLTVQHCQIVSRPEFRS